MSTELLIEKYASAQAQAKALHPVVAKDEINGNDDVILRGTGAPLRKGRPADEPVVSDMDNNRIVPNSFELEDKEEDLGLQESNYEIYHKLYADAMAHAEQVAKKRGYEVDQDDWSDKVSSGPKKPSEGKTNSLHINLIKNGKPAREKLHVQVYNRGGTKPYELNMYIESAEVSKLGFQLEESTGNFSKSQIDRLRKEWSSIDKIDPDSPTYTRLTKMLDAMNKQNLEQLAGAKIKFISPLAMNRVNKMQKPLQEGERFRTKTKDGNFFIVTDRDTKGMPGSQDKFKMAVVDGSGKVVKDLGSHVSVEAAKGFAKARKIVEDRDIISVGDKVVFREIPGTVLSLHESEFVFLSDDGRSRPVEYNHRDMKLVEAVVSEEVSITEAVITDLHKIVEEKQEKSVKFANGKTLSVDLTTANALVKVYGSLNESNKSKFEDNLNKGPTTFMKMVDFAFGMLK